MVEVSEEEGAKKNETLRMVKDEQEKEYKSVIKEYHKMAEIRSMELEDIKKTIYLRGF